MFCLLLHLFYLFVSVFLSSPFLLCAKEQKITDLKMATTEINKLKYGWKWGIDESKECSAV